MTPCLSSMKQLKITRVLCLSVFTLFSLFMCVFWYVFSLTKVQVQIGSCVQKGCYFILSCRNPCQNWMEFFAEHILCAAAAVCLFPFSVGIFNNISPAQFCVRSVRIPIWSFLTPPHPKEGYFLQGGAPKAVVLTQCLSIWVLMGGRQAQ